MVYGDSTPSDWHTIGDALPVWDAHTRVVHLVFTRDNTDAFASSRWAQRMLSARNSDRKYWINSESRCALNTGAPVFRGVGLRLLLAWLRRSDDLGVSWAPPKNITHQAVKSRTAFIGTGVCIGGLVRCKLR